MKTHFSINGFNMNGRHRKKKGLGTRNLGAATASRPPHPSLILEGDPAAQTDVEVRINGPLLPIRPPAPNRPTVGP